MLKINANIIKGIVNIIAIYKFFFQKDLSQNLE